MPKGTTLTPGKLVASIEREIIRCQKMGPQKQAEAAAKAAIEFFAGDLPDRRKTRRLVALLARIGPADIAAINLNNVCADVFADRKASAS